MKQKNAVRMVWRWDNIFRVYRCPYCGRPEKPCFELWKKGGLKKSCRADAHTAKENWKEWKEKKMIIEILELASALEWIALGVLVFFELRDKKRRLDAAIKKLEDAIR